MHIYIYICICIIHIYVYIYIYIFIFIGSASAADLFFADFVISNTVVGLILVDGLGLAARFGCGTHVSKVFLRFECFCNLVNGF